MIKQNKKVEKAVKDAGRALRTIEMQEITGWEMITVFIWEIRKKLICDDTRCS